MHHISSVFSCLTDNCSQYPVIFLLSIRPPHFGVPWGSDFFSSLSNSIFLVMSLNIINSKSIHILASLKCISLVWKCNYTSKPISTTKTLIILLYLFRNLFPLNATLSCFCSGQKPWHDPWLPTCIFIPTSNSSRNTSICTSRYFQNTDASCHIYHNHPSPAIR